MHGMNFRDHCQLKSGVSCSDIETVFWDYVGHYCSSEVCLDILLGITSC